jgi:hypothetical protein
MNLMFWKKKPGSAAEADDAPEGLAVNTKPREPLDFMEDRQDVTVQEPELAEAGEGDTDTPSKPGLAAGMRSRFDALMQRFRRPPPFRAADDIAAEASGADGKAETAADTEQDMDAPAKPGLSMRMKLQFIAIAQRFRKKHEADGEGNDGSDEPGEEDGDEEVAAQAPAKPDLLKRLKVALAAFVREFRSSAEPATDEEHDEDEHGRPKSEQEDGGVEAEVEAGPVRSRRWLVIGGSIVIVILMLANFAIANWPIFKEPQKRQGTRHDTDAIPSRSGAPDPAHKKLSAPALEEPSPEVEALRRENAELQAQVEALGRARQRPSAPPARPYGGSAAALPSGSGELAVGSENPKAAAMTLKEAIEAMNATTGDDK